jgi:hypothetical protein
MEIAGWVGRLVGASGEQIGRRYGLGRTQVYRRVRVLSAQGLLRRRKVLIGRPAVYMAPGRRLRVSGYEHALAVSELVVGRELAGASVITEREVRRLRVLREPFGVDLDDTEAETILSCRRTPDAIERKAGGLIAYEVELSSKGRARRERVLGAYAFSTYERVRWIVPDPRLRALVKADANDHGLIGFMEVVDDYHG